MSLNEVSCATGITATQLNRIELDEVKEPSPEVLKKLFVLYKINLLKLYELAKYIDSSLYISKSHNPFYNCELLGEEEISSIQNMINLFAKKISMNLMELKCSIN